MSDVTKEDIEEAEQDVCAVLEAGAEAMFRTRAELVAKTDQSYEAELGEKDHARLAKLIDAAFLDARVSMGIWEYGAALEIIKQALVDARRLHAQVLGEWKGTRDLDAINNAFGPLMANLELLKDYVA